MEIIREVLFVIVLRPKGKRNKLAVGIFNVDRQMQPHTFIVGQSVKYL